MPKIIPKPKYKVIYGVPNAVPNCNTVEDLQQYLLSDPMPDYRLASCNYTNGMIIIIWERIN